MTDESGADMTHNGRLKAVILAGGLGTRISEESHLKPKPMVEIGGKPILWHIMKLYSSHGVNDFIVCCGYKGYVIKEYFSNYFLHTSDITFDIATEHDGGPPAERGTLACDAGGYRRENSNTGGRLKRVRHYLARRGSILLHLWRRGCRSRHCGADRLPPPARQAGHGVRSAAPWPLRRAGSGRATRYCAFRKSRRATGLGSTAGSSCCQPRVIDYIEGDATSWENTALGQIAQDGELQAWEHHGFWQAMDTLRDKIHLEDLWASGRAPWKIWS